MINPLRILYIDDSALDRELVRDALIKENSGEYLLTEATSRPEFETLLIQGKFDLVLSDFNILGFDGLQVLDLVQMADAALPVIIVTGTGNEEVAVEAMKRGAGDYVIKTPSHIRRLPQTIRAVLEKRSFEIERQQAAEELRRTNEQLAAIIREAPLAVITLDLEGNILTWNPVAELLVGWSEAEALGKPFPLVSWGQTGEFHTILAKALRGEAMESQEIRRQRRDGSWLVAQLHTAPLHDSLGNSTGLLVIMEDILEHKQAEQKIRDLARFPSENPNPVLRVSRDGIVLYANAASTRLVALWNCQIGGRLPAELRDEIRSVFEARQNFRREICIEDRFFSMLLVPIPEGGYVNLYAEDITERKQAELAIYESGERFQALTQSVDDAIVITDYQRRIIFWNKGAEHLFLYAAEEILGQDPSILMPDTERLEYLNSIAQKKAPGNSHPIRMDNVTTALRKDGSKCLVEISGSSWGTDKQRCFGTIIRDITERKRAEEELQFRNLLLVTQQEAAIDGVLVVDEEAHIISYNRRFLELWGIPVKLVEDGIDEPLLAYVTPQIVNPQTFVERVEYLYAHKNETSQDELTLVDGRVIDRYSAPMFGQNERYYGRIWYFRDISERKRAEEALRISEAKYRILVENLPQKIFSKDLNSNYLSCNDSYARDLGIQPDEIAGRTDYDFFPKEMADAFRADDLRIMQSGKSEVIEERYLQFGKEIWNQTLKAPILEPDGTISGILAIFWDITERKQAEEALRQSELRLALHVRQTPLAVIEFDPQHHVVKWNPAAEKIFGYKAEEIIGKHIHILVPKHLQAQVDRVMDDLVAMKGSERSMNENTTRDGRLIFCDWYNTPLVTQNGELIGIASMVQDITGQIQAQKELVQYRDHLEELVKERTVKLLESEAAAENANHAKSIFLANMSHEIRTPMNAILGFTQLMLRDPTFPPSHRHHLETVNRCGENLLDLINDILEMSKIEAGRITLTPTTFDLPRLIHDLEMMFQIRTSIKSLNFEVIVQGELTQYVVADENKLRQIFINLLGNAAKFTDRGGISWRIQTTTSPTGNLRLISEVEDTGPGIDPEEMGKLFQVFGQTTAGALKGGGTGLGLAISSKFAQMMAGNLTVKSQVGKGSTFKVELEIREGQGNEVANRKPSQRVIRISPHQVSKRILVVDDNFENRQLVLELLHAVGFEVNEAANGKEALQAFLEWEPHLILMDIHMPVMDGYEAIQWIKAAKKGLHLPIIAITAHAFIEDEKKALAAGADAYMRKPLKDFELFSAIATLLGVQYEYEQSLPALPVELNRKGSSSTKILTELPEELISPIRQATLAANMGRLLELIDQLGQQMPQTADQLRLLANDYQYDQLLAILPDEKSGQ